jgi:hypothetical protein
MAFAERGTWARPGAQVPSQRNGSLSLFLAFSSSPNRVASVKGFGSKLRSLQKQCPTQRATSSFDEAVLVNQAEFAGAHGMVSFSENYISNQRTAALAQISWLVPETPI